MRLQQQRKDSRMMEAMQSPRWDTKVVAGHNFLWLRRREELPKDMDLKQYAGTILHRMVLDGQFAATLCAILDVWKAWADNGGMRKTDVAVLQEDLVTFAQASILLAIIHDPSTALEGTLSMDLQECMRMWRTVRLG